ncbi:MAG: peptide MFS transporter [Muribaculaceae bacterium]|nr:peptide MFS transporter [Muribaculaceae bacterium]
MLQFLSDFWNNNQTVAILCAILVVVVPLLVFYIIKARREHPKGLIPAAIANMGERFGYYIMNAVLLLFLCSKFGISDDLAGWIYAVFYFLIYVLSLPGGLIADHTQKYKATIISGLLVMALGYGLLSIPVFSGTADGGVSWILVFTCFALFLIAFGNGLFKGNLQAIVGQMYDNFEAEAAKKGPEALEIARSRRDSGFQIFYVFINIGGVIAPFIAPLLREFWLNAHALKYNADLPRLCHMFINDADGMSPADSANLAELAGRVGFNGAVDSGFCTSYLEIFNTGVHFSFIASVVAMLISMGVFVWVMKRLPNPVKKVKAASVSAEEVKHDAREIRQRMYALYAVLGVVVFFWFSFHQNGQSLSVFARDFVTTDNVAPEIWQCINPFFVIVLTPLIMLGFAALVKRGKEVSTPRKIAYGMLITALAYIFLIIVAVVHGYPSGEEFRSLGESVKMAMKSGPYVLIITYLFLTVAELFISPLGLSFVSKIAPKHLQGICQGLWLTSTAVGNLFIALGVTMLNVFPQQWMCWAVFAGFCLLSMTVMLSMVKWLEKATK